MKNPTLTTVLNIIPGLGYIYLGGKKRIFGSVLLVSGILSTVAGIFADPTFYSEEYVNAAFTAWDTLGLLSAFAFVGAFMYDGYISTLSYNATQK